MGWAGQKELRRNAGTAEGRCRRAKEPPEEWRTGLGGERERRRRREERGERE
jgi:hypothetical protein